MGKAIASLFLTAGVVLISGCAGSRQLQAQSMERGTNPEICSSNASGHELQWVFQPDVTQLHLLSEIGQNKLPSKFQVYSIDEQQLKLYLMVANNEGKQTPMALPLSEGVGCQVFELSSSGTMSSELAVKYPQLISLKGGSAAHNGDVRIDFDGTKMEGLVNWDGQTFMISPWSSSSGARFYLVYKKEDSGQKKIPRKPY